MGISVAHQTWAFLWSIAFGMGLGLLFDGFRILRLILPSPRWLVGLEDLLYCLMAAFLCGGFLLRVNQGELRSFVLVGEILGWVLYFFTFGALVMKGAKAVIRLVRRVSGVLFRRVIVPLGRFFRRICRLFLRPVKFIRKILKKLLRNGKFALKQRPILLYNLIKSKKRPVFRKANPR